MEIRPGDAVNLVVTWGAQSRLQCPRCRHFMRAGESPVTCRCGASYAPLAAVTEAHSHEVVFA